MIITSKFDGRCKACGGQIKAGQRVNWIKGVQGVTHETAAACAAAPKAAAPAATVTANAKPIADFLHAARERGLKFPKVAFLGPNSAELKMTLAGPNSKNPGAVFVYVGGEYSGSVAVDGTVRGALANKADVLGALAEIANNPTQAAQAYSKLTGNCTFCLKKLSDDRSGASLEHGYGKRCAQRYNMPWHATGKKGAIRYAPVVSTAGADAMAAA